MVFSQVRFPCLGHHPTPALTHGLVQTPHLLIGLSFPPEVQQTIFFLPPESLQSVETLHLPPISALAHFPLLSVHLPWQQVTPFPPIP